MSLVDVFATVLAAHGARAFAGRGVGARPARADAAGDGAPIFAEYYYPLQALGLFGRQPSQAQLELLAPHLRRLRSIEADGMRFIWSSDGRHELFDLAEPTPGSDATSSATVAGRARATAARALAAFVERRGATPPADGGRASDGPGAFDGLDPESASCCGSSDTCRADRLGLRRDGWS